MSPLSPTPADNRDLQSVLEVTDVMREAPDLEALLAQLLLVAMGKVLSTRGAVLLGEEAAAEGGIELTVVVVKGGGTLRKGDRFRVEVAASPIRLQDGPLLDAGYAVQFPITHQGRPIGVVLLGPKATRQAFPDSEVAFVRSLVGLSSSAVLAANMAARLQESNRDLARRVQELRTLFDLSQEFGRVHDRESALRLLSLTLMGQFLAPRHMVLLREGGRLEVGVAGRGQANNLGSEVIDFLEALESPWRQDNGRAELAASGHHLAVPIRIRGEMQAVILLGPRGTGLPYSDGDVAFLSALGTLAVSAIENADLVKSLIAKERLEQEMRMARQIQERLLPSALPTVEGIELSVLAVPSREVAGDYYDAEQLADGQLLLAVADVSGKGAPASLLMANLQACFRFLRPEAGADIDLAQISSRITRVITANTNAASFITCWWGLYDPATRRLRYVNAGHNPPVVARADGTIETLNEGGLLLGVLSEARYDEGALDLAPGDVLAVYSDGLTEALDAAGEEYGEDRFYELLGSMRTCNAGHIVDGVRKDVQRYSGSTTFGDDLTLLVGCIS
ncbi:hypothetical protein BH23BAC4_BH23BAC4_09730 [soil metagenome]